MSVDANAAACPNSARTCQLPPASLKTAKVVAMVVTELALASVYCEVLARIMHCPANCGKREMRFRHNIKVRVRPAPESQAWEVCQAGKVCAVFSGDRAAERALGFAKAIAIFRRCEVEVFERPDEARPAKETLRFGGILQRWRCRRVNGKELIKNCWQICLRRLCALESSRGHYAGYSRIRRPTPSLSDAVARIEKALAALIYRRPMH